MPKILDWLKEKNIPHEDAMKYLETYKPELISEDEKAERLEKEKKDKLETPTPPAETPTQPPITPTTPEAPTDKLDINKITEDLKKEVDKITKDLKDKYSMLRSAPPKGVESDQPVDNKPLITKNLFEVRI